MTELVELFVLPLERAGIPYVVTGSLAAMAYGEPRLTNDIDLILDLRSDAVASLEGCFPESEFYRPPTEVVEAEIVRAQRGHFNLIHLDSMLRADVYLRGGDVLHEWALAHRRRIVVDAHPISFAPPEYVILRKLQFFAEGGSEKHLRDIASMLGESGDQIDLDWVETRARDYGLSAHWCRARSFRG